MPERDVREAWDDLVDRIDQLLAAVVHDDGVTDDIDAAEGLRHVLRVLDASVALLVEGGDRRRPELLRLLGPIRKFYFDNPDASYDTAAVRGDIAYRLHGRLDTVDYLSLCVYGTEGGRRVVASVSGDELTIGPDGSVDVRIGGEAPADGGDWLPLAADADSFVLRQYFREPVRDQAVDVRLDPVDPVGPPPPLAPVSLARRLDASRDMLSFAVELAQQRARSVDGTSNQIVLETVGGNSSTPFGTPDNAYVAIRFHVEPDEALLLEGVPPESRYWGVHVANRWGESLDYESMCVSRNAHTTTLDEDGSFRYVVSHVDTGDPNHLDLGGHRDGFLLLRWTRCEPPPPPTVRIVPVADLGQAGTGSTIRSYDEEGRATLDLARRTLVAALRRSGDAIDAATADAGPLDRAEGYRAILRLLSTFRELAVERGDRRRPVPTRVMSAQRKLLGDNPDVVYDSIPIVGDRRYRITGRRGSHEYLAVSAYEGTAGSGVSISGNVSDRDIQFDSDAAFAIMLSPTPPDDPVPGETWMATTPDTTTLIVRQYVGDPTTETLTTYRIDPLDDPGPLRALSSAAVARRVNAAAFMVEGVLAVTVERLGALAVAPNQIQAHADAEAAAALYPTPDNHYVVGWFDIGPDQALVVEGAPPDCRYWSLQLWNRWGESLDWRHHVVSRNMAQARIDGDGRYRFVLAHRDPGPEVGEWLDLAGHEQGVACFRWMQAPDHPVPVTRLVELGR